MLNKLSISGFRGLTRTVDFGRTTLVSGGNGLGKTTVLDAIRWCLVGVDGEDKSNNNIFNNRKVDGGKETVDVRCVFVDADGMESVFGRTATRKGDKVEYSYRCGDVEVSAKKYGECMEDMFMPVPQMKFILNVRRWDLLDESVLRKALIGLYDNGSIICEEAYSEIKERVELSGIEETKKQYRKDMRDCQKALDTIQVELNMIEQGIPEEISSGDLQKRLEEREVELKRLEESPSEVPSELRERVQTEARELAALEAEYEEERQRHHLNYTMRLQELKSTYGQTVNDKHSLERLTAELECEKAVVENSRTNLDGLRQEYDELMKRVFEGACPCCGRPYEGPQRDEMEAEWRRKKDEMISGIKARAKRIKDNAEAAKERIAECERRIAEVSKADPSAVMDEIKRMETEGEVSFASTERGKELQSRIDAAKASRTDVSAYDRERMNGMASLRDEIFSLKMRFAEADEIRKRREDGLAKAQEVKTRQAQGVKRLSEAERLLALTNRYEMASLQGLQDYLNDMLNTGEAGSAGEMDGTHISLYHTDDSGEVHPQCKVVSRGVSDTINNSARTAIGVRLAEALIRKSGKEIPILIDNVESMDRNHRPKSECQLIMSKVDDEGSEFKVEIQ